MIEMITTININMYSKYNMKRFNEWNEMNRFKWVNKFWSTGFYGSLLLSFQLEFQFSNQNEIAVKNLLSNK